MKKNFLIQITLGVLITMIYFIVLYYNAFLDDYCFDFDDCREIIIYNLMKLLLLFVLANSVWLFNIQKIKTVLLLISNLLFFSFFIIGNEAFFCTPFILSIVLFHLIYVNIHEKNMTYLVISNIIIFILLNFMYLSFEEFLSGIPFSLEEIKKSGNLFGNYILVSGGAITFLTISSLLISFRKNRNSF